MQKLLHDIPETLELLGGMGRATLYVEIGSGRIATVKIGRRTYIAHDELQRYVRSLASVEPETAA